MPPPAGAGSVVPYAPFIFAVAQLHSIARLAARSLARLGRRAGQAGSPALLTQPTSTNAMVALGLCHKPCWDISKCPRPQILSSINPRYAGYKSKRKFLVPKDYRAFVTNRGQVNLSTVNDFCKVVSNFPTVEDQRFSNIQPYY